MLSEISGEKSSPDSVYHPNFRYENIVIPPPERLRPLSPLSHIQLNIFGRLIERIPTFGIEFSNHDRGHIDDPIEGKTD